MLTIRYEDRPNSPIVRHDSHEDIVWINNGHPFYVVLLGSLVEVERSEDRTRVIEAIKILLVTLALNSPPEGFDTILRDGSRILVGLISEDT